MANLRSNIFSTIDNLRELVSIHKASGIDNIVVDICTEAIRDINRLSIENKALKNQVSDLRATIDCANGSWI